MGHIRLLLVVAIMAMVAGGLAATSAMAYPPTPIRGYGCDSNSFAWIAAMASLARLATSSGSARRPKADDHS
jgi:hypothetical protein